MTEKEAARAFKAAQREVLAERTLFLRETRDRIVALLEHALEEIKVTLAGAPSDYERWNLPQLKAEIEQALETFKAGASAQMSTAAGAAWELGQRAVDAPIAASGIRAALPHLDNRQLLAMRAFTVDRIKDIGVQAGNRVGNELGLVAIGSQSPGDAISNITRIMGEPSRARATTIVRTELGRTFAVAAQERLVQAAERVPGMKKQWRKSGKTHPRLHHDLADGQVREVGEPFVLGGGRVKLMHPHDPAAPASETINCGCVAIAWKADWKVSHPGRLPGGRMDDGVPIAKIAGLRESFNRGQRRAPKGSREGGRWVAGPRLADLAGAAIANRQTNATHDLGAVTIGNAAAVQKATGLRLDGFRREANDSHLRHALDRHGLQGREDRYHQRALTPADFGRIRSITTRPDSVTLTREGRRGSAALIYERRFGNEVYVYTEAVHAGRYRLELLTLYVRAGARK